MSATNDIRASPWPPPSFHDNSIAFSFTPFAHLLYSSSCAAFFFSRFLSSLFHYYPVLVECYLSEVKPGEERVRVWSGRSHTKGSESNSAAESLLEHDSDLKEALVGLIRAALLPSTGSASAPSHTSLLGWKAIGSRRHMTRSHERSWPSTR